MSVISQLVRLRLNGTPICSHLPVSFDRLYAKVFKNTHATKHQIA